MKLPRLDVGDLWGGTAAMLVALPSAIAFGVTVYFPFGAEHVAQGALAGILGAIALGLVAPLLGGTQRLITAPCAPAAAVLAAFSLEAMQGGGDFASALVLLPLLGLGAGLLQIAFGTLRLGQLIAYMPYPVVSGYLSGVGLYIIAGQVPKLLGTPMGLTFWHALAAPAAWQWQSLAVGAATIAVMLLAPRITQRVPAAILGLVAGVATYFALGLVDARLLVLEGNAFVVGPLGGSAGNLLGALGERWQAAGSIGMHQLVQVGVPALTLAALLSIDTLKTCLVIDTLTRTRHNSNRELVAQGSANVAAALLGGIPGSGTMGATLMNISSGAQTSRSAVIEGVLALAAFLVLGSLISWVPVAALAATLIVIGARMIDRHSLAYLKQRSTVLDFAVIVAVVFTALTVSLIAASGVGILLAVVLFVREEAGGVVVRRKAYGHQTFSRRVRTQQEMAILSTRGQRTVVMELQGSLFFGTANQLYLALEPELKLRDYVILDMRRVQSVDVTAAHMLEQIKDMLAERKGFLIFSQLPDKLPSGRDMQRYFKQIGLVRPQSPVRVFGELDDALEWAEDRVLEEAAIERGPERPLELAEIELFKGRKPETLSALEQHMERRTCKAGAKIFARGDAGDELFIIRAGLVRITLLISDQLSHHVATFGRGAFFGEMGFLDGAVRSADAVADTDTELFVLTRGAFNGLAEEHRKLAMSLMAGLASTLASRLRYTNAELRMLGR